MTLGGHCQRSVVLASSLYGQSQPMWRVELTPEQSRVICKLIDEFVDHPPDKLGWQVPFVREQHALPLYIGWTETTAITSTGDIVIWSTEKDVRFIEEISRQLFHASLMEGVKRYSNVEFLIPPRPHEAVTCDACFGTGRIPHKGLENLICICGGVGWLAPDSST